MIGCASAISDALKSMQTICAENGFLYQEHQMITEDGYVLQVMRIPGIKGKPLDSRPPVFFQHGILAGADTWVVHNNEVAPAFVAARNGYDVWMGNSRGNIYSDKHVSLDTSSAEFWDFDW